MARLLSQEEKQMLADLSSSFPDRKIVDAVLDVLGYQREYQEFGEDIVVERNSVPRNFWLALTAAVSHGVARRLCYDDPEGSGNERISLKTSIFEMIVLGLIRLLEAILCGVEPAEEAERSVSRSGYELTDSLEL